MEGRDKGADAENGLVGTVGEEVGDRLREQCCHTYIEGVQPVRLSPSSRGSSPPRDRTWGSFLSCIGRQVLYH